MNKILIVSDLIGGPGGVYKQFELIEKYLSDKVSLLFLFDDSTKKYVKENYIITSKKFIKLSTSLHDPNVVIDNFKKALAVFDPNLIHIVNGSIRSNLVLREYCAINKIPFIVTESLIDIKTEVSDKKERIQKVNKYAEIVIYVSKDSKKVAKNFFNVHAKKSIVIYNSPEQIFKKKECYSVKPYRLFTTARCSPQKGIDIIIRALAETKQRNIVFHVFGDGEYTKDYIALSKKIIGNKHIFKIFGWNNNLDYQFIGSNYDLFISASRSEGFSYSNLESASLGMPMICSRVPGNTEFINLSKCGILYSNPENPSNLAREIDKFIENPTDLNLKALNGPIAIDKFFNLNKNMSLLLSLYQKYAK